MRSGGIEIEPGQNPKMMEPEAASFVRMANMPAVACLVIWLAACSGRTVEPEETGAVCGGGMQVEMDVETPVRRVDVLMVVDNSRSMTEEQAWLAESLPEFLSRVMAGERDEDAFADLHIGVVSTDLGTGGYTVDSCEDPVDGDDGELLEVWCPPEGSESEWLPGFLDYPLGWEGSFLDLTTSASCMAQLGIHGCGFEQQLEAAYRALSPEHLGWSGPNAGFLRDDSLLVVLWLTDEEDCSVADLALFDISNVSLGHIGLRCYLHPDLIHPVARYVEGLTRVRQETGRLLVGMLVGVPMDPACEGRGDEIESCLEHEAMVQQLDPTDPTRLLPVCDTAQGLAFGGARLVQVAQALGSRALVGSICNAGYADFMQRLARMAQKSAGGGEIEEPLPWEQGGGDPCRCRAACTLVQSVPAGLGCQEGAMCWEPAGEGTGCGTETDEQGQVHDLCVIEQVDTVLTDCMSACDDPGAARRADDGSGWMYTPGQDGPGNIDWVRWEPATEASGLRLICCHPP